MSPSISDAKITKTVRDVIEQARKDDTVDALTPRIIRREVEQLLGVDAGTLDPNPYKDLVKDTALSILNGDDDEPKPQKKDKDDDTTKAPRTKKRKSDESISSEPVAKKAKAAPKDKDKSPKETSTRPKKVKVDTRKYKSPAQVATSDVEQDEPDEDPMVERVAPVTYKTASSGSPKVSPKKKRKLTTIASEDESDGGKKPSKPKPKASAATAPSKPKPKPKPKSKVDRDESEGVKSESELSVLDDDPPPKRTKKSTTKDKVETKKKPVKEKKPRKSAATLSKEEETIKKLKSFVVACGVRKVWSKVFSDIEDQPAKQIRRLKEILAELGMSEGRMSLEKARAIKQKRELAKELEDVQSFEKAVVAGGSKTRGKAAEEEAQEDDSGEESQDAEAPTKRKSNARLSIMAFLGDQSDDE